MVAQDVEDVLAEIATVGTDGEKAAAYTEIIPVLIEAIKAQQDRIEELRARVAELEQ